MDFFIYFLAAISYNIFKNILSENLSRKEFAMTFKDKTGKVRGGLIIEKSSCCNVAVVPSRGSVKRFVCGKCDKKIVPRHFRPIKSSSLR